MGRAGESRSRTTPIDQVTPIMNMTALDAPGDPMPLVRQPRDHGILATGLAYSLVPRGDEEIRAQINADHTEADIDYVLDVLANRPGAGGT